jgi:hypothetical protein
VKHLGRTLVALAALALVAGLLCYRLSLSPELHAAVAKGDALSWLKTDFHLDERQFAEIQKLHAAYAPSCEEHCRLIQEATVARDALKARQGADPAAVAAAERTLQELRLNCETAIAAHVRQVAAVMSPDDGRRYLALVLPKIADFDHRMAPDLALQQGHRH